MTNLVREKEWYDSQITQPTKPTWENFEIDLCNEQSSWIKLVKQEII